MIEKNSWSLYLLCLLLVITPIYFVWSKLPEILSDCEETAKEQIIHVSLIGAIPFGFVLGYALVLCVKKMFSNYL
jgi:hypothetical protein